MEALTLPEIGEVSLRTPRYFLIASDALKTELAMA